MTLEGVNTPLSGTPSIDALIWQDHATYDKELPFKNYINFTFDTSQIPDSTVRSGATAMDSTQQQCVRNALSYVNSVTGIFFNEVPNGTSANVDLVFGYKPLGVTSDVRGSDFYKYTFTAGSTPTLDISDTILLNSDNAGVLYPGLTTVGYTALLHEIGHALGMKHPTDTPNAIASIGDTTSQTVMGYVWQDATQPTAYTGMDLAALNWIYGGKGLVNKNQVPIGGSATGSWTVLDQGPEQGLFAQA